MPPPPMFYKSLFVVRMVPMAKICTIGLSSILYVYSFFVDDGGAFTVTDG